MHIFLFGQGLKHWNKIFAVFIQINRIQVQFNLAAFNAGHVKHIVDQRQEVFTRKFRLAKAIQSFCLVVNILYRHVGKADHCVKRCADVMRHIEQERTLCLIGKFSLFQARHFTFSLGIDTMETGNHMVLGVFILNKLYLIVNIFTINLQSKVNEVNMFAFNSVQYL